MKPPFRYAPTRDQMADGKSSRPKINHFVLDANGDEIACAPDARTARLFAASWHLLQACKQVLGGLQTPASRRPVMSEWQMKSILETAIALTEEEP